MRNRIQPGVIVGGVLLGLATASAQPTPQFKAGTELVVVDVVATRADGSVVHGLTQSDFEIIEDGRQQPIRTFEFVDLEAPERATDPSGVFSNQTEPGAVFAMVMDELSVEPRHTRSLRRWATRFVDEQMRPDDYLGVMNTGKDFALMLTRDRDVARTKIAAAYGRGERLASPVPTGTVATEMPDGTTVPDFSAVDLVEPSAELRQRTEKTLVSLRQVVEYLARIPARRKAMVYFGQGIDMDLESLASSGSSRALELVGRLLEAARVGNVAIYAIDPRGLAANDEVIASTEPMPVLADQGIDGLRDLARATGGRAIVNSNEIDGALGRIARENRAYYLLGYEPSDRTAPRQRGYRRIEVTTSAPGVTLLHRVARVPADSVKEPPPPNPVTAPLPGGSLRVAFAPTLYSDLKGQLSIAVPFELGTELGEGTPVEYSLIALETSGRQAEAVKGSVRAAGGHASGLTRLRLAPGHYQLRLMASTLRGALTGLAIADLEIPRAGAEQPMCVGFLLAQPHGQALRPNVTRRFSGAAPIVVSAVVSSRESMASRPARFAAVRIDSGKGFVWPAPEASAVAKGLWRYELALPAPLPQGNLELVLLDGDREIRGCMAELRIEE